MLYYIILYFYKVQFLRMVSPPAPQDRTQLDCRKSSRGICSGKMYRISRRIQWEYSQTPKTTKKYRTNGPGCAEIAHG